MLTALGELVVATRNLSLLVACYGLLWVCLVWQNRVALITLGAVAFVEDGAWIGNSRTLGGPPSNTLRAGAFSRMYSNYCKCCACMSFCAASLGTFSFKTMMGTGASGKTFS